MAIATPVRNTLDSIENAVVLINIFGYWPSFHDASIVSFRFCWSDTRASSLSLETGVELFEMTSQVHADGYYVLTKHTFAKLHFTNVELLEPGVTLNQLQLFTRGAALNEIQIEAAVPSATSDTRFKVVLNSSYGPEIHFFCEQITVKSAEHSTSQLD